MYAVVKRVWDKDVVAIFATLWVTGAVATALTALVAR